MPIEKSAFLDAIGAYRGSVAEMEYVGRQLDEHLDQIAALRKYRSEVRERKLAAMEILKRSMTREAFAELVGYRDLQHG